MIESDNRLLQTPKTCGKAAAHRYRLENVKGISRVEHLPHRTNEGLVDPFKVDKIIPLDEDERLSIDGV